MVFLNYYVGVDDEMKEILTALNVRTYTRFPETERRISRGEPREGTHVWPGSNSTMLVVVEDEAADSLVRKVEEFNAVPHGKSVAAYVLDVTRSAVNKGA